MFYDLPLDELKKYCPDIHEPEDFDTFWADTLAEVRSTPLQAKFHQVDFGLSAFKTFDVSFCGYGGQEIKGWFIHPVDQTEPRPCVVQYIGYPGGRSFPTFWLLFPAAGYCTFVMDTRGQGSDILHGDTPDLQSGTCPHVAGYMTDGILEPETYFYRRVFSDAVRAVEAARQHPLVDKTRIAVSGHSQGGGISLAVSGLVDDINVVMTDAPFLCHYRRAVEVTDSFPFFEITKYCRSHRDQVDVVFNTLSYFDGVSFAARANAKALFSMGMMDTVCPPSTVFAAYNHYKGEKEIKVYEYNDHEAGHEFQKIEQLKFLKQNWEL